MGLLVVLFQLKLYNDFFGDVTALALDDDVRSIWLSPESCNYMVYDSAISGGEVKNMNS